MRAPTGRSIVLAADRHPEARPTYWATQLSLTRLAGGLTAAGLLWLATWTALAPPEDVPGPWRTYGLLTAGLALIAAGSAIWPHLPGSRWTPLTTAAIALISLATVSDDTGLIGWWPTLELAALLALAATVALPTPAAAVAQVAVIVGSFVVMMRTSTTFAVATGPAAIVSDLARLLVAAITLLVGNAVLRRASRATDNLLAQESHERELLETEARRRRTDRDARRFLHDSGMNSLESVSRGIPAGSVDLLRRRCATDAERWLQAAAGPTDDTVDAFGPALAEATVRGLSVESEFAVDGRLPDDVLHALADATSEALRNSAKHSGGTITRLTVRVGQGRATVTVADTGRGFDPTVATSRLGMAESIVGRLRDVGGEADVDSAPGQGTTITLRWPVATGRAGGPDPGGGQSSSHVDPAFAHDLLGILGRLAWLPIAAVAVGAVASTAANWWSVHVPWLLGLSGLLLAAAGGWLVHRWRTAALDVFDLAVATLALVVATLIAPVADPFCSAASGPPLIPDGRLVILAVVGVLLASWRVSVAMLAATLVALGVASLMWLSLWPMCAPETTPTAIGLTLVTVAGVAFGTAVRHQEASASRAFAAMEATNLALARGRADELARAEWEIAAVAQVRDLLRRIADPATDLDDPGLRAAAGDAAARLRAAVRASELPGPLAAVLAKLVDLGRMHGFGVTIEGDLGTADGDHTGRGTADGDHTGDTRGSEHTGRSPDPLPAVAAALDTWLAHHGAATTAAVVTLTDFGGIGSVLVQLRSAAAAALPITAAVDPPTPATHDLSTPPANALPEAPPPPAASAQVRFDSWIDGPDLWWQAEWVITAA